MSKALLLPILFLLLQASLLTSCSSFKSGHYVRSKNGKWVFVPLRRGILGQESENIISNIDRYISSGDFMWPVPSSKRISSNYGKRWGRPHEGIDISAKQGRHILASAGGVVVYVGNGLGGYGNTTVISHKNGFYTVYAHAHKNFTKKGQRVHRGQVIAQVGSTGRTTGPHLHFEIRHYGRAYNPLKLLAKH